MVTNFRLGRTQSGRVTLFTPERRKTIVEAIREGNYGQQAASAARVSTHALRAWLHKGEVAALKLEEGEDLEPDEAEFAQFFYDCMEADAEAESAAVREVRQAGESGNWIASMTYLERRHPERWKRRDAVEHTGPGGGPMKVEIDNSPAKLAEVMAVLLEAGFAPEGLKLAAPTDGD